MISLKDVLGFILISVFARNIVIFAVNSGKQQELSQALNTKYDYTDCSNTDDESAKMKGKMMLSDEQDGSSQPPKTIYDYTLIKGDRNKVLRYFINNHDLVLYVLMDPHSPEFNTHIENLNSLKETYKKFFFHYRYIN